MYTITLTHTHTNTHTYTHKLIHTHTYTQTDRQTHTHTHSCSDQNNFCVLQHDLGDFQSIGSTNTNIVLMPHDTSRRRHWNYLFSICRHHLKRSDRIDGSPASMIDGSFHVDRFSIFNCVSSRLVCLEAHFQCNSVTTVVDILRTSDVCRWKSSHTSKHRHTGARVLKDNDQCSDN